MELNTHRIYFFSVLIHCVINQFVSILLKTNKELERSLNENITRENNNEALLQAIIDAVPYSIFWKDNELKFLGGNTAFIKDANLQNNEELCGKSDFDMPWKNQENQFQVDDNNVIKTGKARLNIEESHTTNDDRTVYMQTNKVPLYTQEGDVIGVLGAYEEITSRKQMELELREAKDAAEQASIAKSEFFANMSHEIRTPLNCVTGLIDLCLNTTLNKTQYKYLATAKSSAQILLSILNDILDLSKIEANKIELEYINFSLSEIQNKLEVFAKPQAIEKGLEFQLESRLDNELVKGDPIRLMQIMLNLLTNALKFTHNGKILIQLNSVINADTTLLEFTIQDSGIGMSPEKVI